MLPPSPPCLLLRSVATTTQVQLPRLATRLPHCPLSHTHRSLHVSHVSALTHVSIRGGVVIHLNHLDPLTPGSELSRCPKTSERTSHTCMLDI